MTAWFCYEKSVLGVWSPVVYYENKPIKMETKDSRRRTPFKLVPEDCLSEVDDTAYFAKLTKLFPLEVPSDD